MDKRRLKPFEQALLDATLEAFADIPSEETIELDFSHGFLKRGEALIAQSRRGRIHRSGKVMRRMILVAAIILAMAVTAAAVPAIREELIKFFAKDAGTHYEFYFDREQAANAPKYIEKVYKPTYIPDGYQEDSSYIGFGDVCYLWCSEDGDILFDQSPIPNDTEGPWPNAENVTVETLNLNGYQVFVVYSNTVSYFWTDNEYLYWLSVPASLPQQEQHRIFYSVAIDEDAEIPAH